MLSANDHAVNRTFFGSFVLGLEKPNQGQTHCPGDPRRVPGATPVLVSSADIAQGIETVAAPMTQFLFCTTIGDIEAVGGYPLWRDTPVYEEWLEIRRCPAPPGPMEHLRIYLDLFTHLRKREGA
jgi:hypothetical protein